jgi:hypothetical protein
VSPDSSAAPSRRGHGRRLGADEFHCGMAGRGQAMHDLRAAAASRGSSRARERSGWHGAEARDLARSMAWKFTPAARPFGPGQARHYGRGRWCLKIVLDI